MTMDNTTERQRRRTDPANWDADAAVSGAVDAQEFGALARQVIIDLYECGSRHLGDLNWVRTTLLEAATRTGATVVDTVLHQLAAQRISGVVIIEESHLSVHVWPEQRCVTIDIFECGSDLELSDAVQFLVDSFESGEPRVFEVFRGRSV